MSSDRISTRDVARSLKNAAADDTRDAADAIEYRDTVDDRDIVDDRDTVEERSVPMFAGDEAEGFRTRWDAVQTGFVDEPRRAVEEADALVAQVIKRLSEVFADERTHLEGQWGRGDKQASTEDLRQALRKYRSFFERLLSL
jgi:hypothetical protein